MLYAKAVLTKRPLTARYYIIFAKVLQNNIRTIQSKLEEETKAKAVAQDHIIAANHRYTHTHKHKHRSLSRKDGGGETNV